MKINKRWVMSFILTVILFLTGEVTAKDDLLLNTGFKEQVKRREDKGLVGLWHFDEGKGDKALDSSKRGNHGQIKGAGWVEGISGQALSFNGVVSAIPEIIEELVRLNRKATPRLRNTK